MGSISSIFTAFIESSIYSKDINSLIQSLSKYTVDELLIEKENLEDTFLNYYKDKGDEI